MSLSERLDKIRSSPRLQNQQQTAVVLGAVEDTLRDQKTDFTPTAYFAALLSLLAQYIDPEKGIVNKEVATAIVYLLDLVTPHVPAPLLRSKFPQILTSLAPALTHPEAEAPLLRASIGCLDSLLIAQDAQAWAQPPTQVSPRRAVAGLLTIAVDHRPKVRKRAQDALANILKNPPPSPSLDHPVADLCAETALKTLKDVVAQAQHKKKKGAHKESSSHEPHLMHTLHLVKTIANSSGGWPSRKVDSLCELLLNISKSSNEFLTMAAFEVFEIIFAGMADEISSAKLPHLLEVIKELQPSQNDSQLLPPWLAVISRAYDVSAQVDPDDTFQNLPEIFSLIAGFLSSPSHNIRVSASECLISFLSNCIPSKVLMDPSIYDEKVLEKVGKTVTTLLSVKYQSAWMEVFTVVEATYESLKWRSAPILNSALKTIGDLRSNESFTGKKEADSVLEKAIGAVGADVVLDVLPLNLARPVAGQPGRAWLLPIMRNSVRNTRLAHFKLELVPLSETMFQRVLDHGKAEKTMEIKIYETVVHQIWATLPGYCELPLDLREAFDQAFAEQLSNLLYQQVELRTDICRALQRLIESNQDIATLVGDDDYVPLCRVTAEEAKENLRYLGSFSANVLAVLFNVYSETLPHNRAPILQSINAWLSIIPEKELIETFNRVSQMLESALTEEGRQTQADKQKQKKNENKMPPTSHTLMDLIITMSIHLPRESFAPLFVMASLLINRDSDPQLQKKAYKLIPRLANSESGRSALQNRSAELQQLLLTSAEKASAPVRRDRLLAISQVITYLPASDLSFIPSILSEVVISAKEVNEKARTAAFDLLISMGARMHAGGTVIQSNVPHMPADAPAVSASIEEYFTMVSAGLAGSTPHMISASVTALSRVLYEFSDTVSEDTVTDLVQTMDLFLTSPNREIVRSVLGFVKVAVISLPETLMRPRLPTLVKNLMVWSHEHKAHFKAKVKHIIERMIRRFGLDVVAKNTPEEDQKLIANIRKTRERRKRKKDAAAGADNDEDDDIQQRRKGKFESEFDEAVYGSDEGSASDEDEDASDEGVVFRGRGKSHKGKAQSFIVEDEDEPLDLLDKRALGHISSTKPLKTRQPPSSGHKTEAKVDVDGKLILGGDDDGDEHMVVFGEDGEKDPGDGTVEGGVGAYVDAIRGRDAAKRGQMGKLKFSNRRSREEDAEMDVDGDDAKKGKAKKSMQKPGLKQKNKGRTGRGDVKGQRRGLGMQKVRGGRVEKARGKMRR